MSVRLCPDPDPSYPHPCRSCGRLCKPMPQGWWRHMRVTCGTWMPNAGERCARGKGHRDDHRTAFAMAYDRERSKRRYAELVAA